MIETVGSVCSGIGAASVAWEGLPLRFLWRSETAPFPSRVLEERLPGVPNLGDMDLLPDMIRAGAAEAPDLVCGGTPCQAFSPAGLRRGLGDGRGRLTLRLADVVQSCDEVRLAAGKGRAAVFWENVEGALRDATNVFGRLLAALAGLDRAPEPPGGRWPRAGLLLGKTRDAAWRVLDARFFGVPQRRRRLYLVAGPKGSGPEDVLFERHAGGPPAFAGHPDYAQQPLVFGKDGHVFETFRACAGCLCSSYGTKWNGNAAARDGSLFVVQDGRIRRFSPLEAERLMGLPDGHTALAGASRTSRYQSIGNSWAVPVVRWIGQQLLARAAQGADRGLGGLLSALGTPLPGGGALVDLGGGLVPLGGGTILNCSPIPEEPCYGSLRDIVSPGAPEEIYLSPAGCQGILRRSAERGLAVDPRLAEVLRRTAALANPEEIERISRIQRRGRRPRQSGAEAGGLLPSG